MLRKKYPAFSSRKLKNIGNDKPDQIVSILKSNNKSKILAILNFSQEKLDVKIDIADSYHSDQKIVDLYSGKKIEISELSDFRIDPFGYYLLKPV